MEELEYQLFKSEIYVIFCEKEDRHEKCGLNLYSNIITRYLELDEKYSNKFINAGFLPFLQK